MTRIYIRRAVVQLFDVWHVLYNRAATSKRKLSSGMRTTTRNRDIQNTVPTYLSSSKLEPIGALQ